MAPEPPATDVAEDAPDEGAPERAPEDDILERVAQRRQERQAGPADEGPFDPWRFTGSAPPEAEEEPAIFRESVETIRRWLSEERELRRTTIVGTLHGSLDKHDWVIAAWLGGADAYGRVDRYSDIDLNVEVADDHVDETFAVVEEALEELTGIDHRWDVPSPTWHGGPERVYRLAEASPYLLVDLVVLPASRGRAALDPERHGSPRFLFDRTDGTAASGADPASLQNLIDVRLTDLGVRIPMLHVLVDKELLRGDALAAMEMYQRFMRGPMIELIRIRHAPHRWDFGLRFTRRDLPQEVWQRLEEMLYVSDIEDLRTSWLRARRWMLDLLEDLANEPPAV